MTWRLFVAGILSCLFLAGCVAPPGNTSSYEAKAVRTADDALSQVQTVRLSVQTDLRGNMLHPYLVTVLSSAEDSFSSIQNTFDSIQPPDSEKADRCATIWTRSWRRGRTG